MTDETYIKGLTLLRDDIQREINRVTNKIILRRAYESQKDMMKGLGIPDTVDELLKGEK